MSTARVYFCLFLSGVFLTSTPTRSSADPVTVFALEYLAGRILDELVTDKLVDGARGRPNIAEIDRRLKELEDNAAMRSEMRDEIRKVREALKTKATREEVRAAVAGLQTQLSGIKQRIDALEERTELQEVQIADLRSKTTNAESPLHFLSRGTDFLATKEYYRAVANLNLAVRLNPKLVAAYVQRAKAYEELKAVEVAILDLSQAVTLDPKNYPALAKRAHLYATRGEYEKAVADATAVLEVHPDDATALHARGYAYIHTGRYERAVVDYRACVKASPRFATGWNNLGVALVSQPNSDPRAAAEAYDRALEIDPNSALSYTNRAVARHKLGLRADAVADSDKAIGLDSRSVRAWEVRGMCQYEGGEHEKAVADLTRAIELGSARHEVYAYRGDWHYAKKDYHKAIADLDAAVRFGATGWAVYENRAGVNYNLGRFADAARDYSVVIKADPGKSVAAKAHWWRGHAQLRNNDRPEYRADLAKALELDSSYQKEIVAGDVLVINKSKSPITIDIDFYIEPDGTRQKFYLPCQYEFKAGESAYLVYDKNQIVAKKFQAYVKTDKGKKLYVWDYTAGVRLEVVVTDADLP